MECSIRPWTCHGMMRLRKPLTSSAIISDPIVARGDASWALGRPHEPYAPYPAAPLPPYNAAVRISETGVSLMDRKPYAAEPRPAAQSKESGTQLEDNRREFVAGLAGTAVLTAVSGTHAAAQDANRVLNVARVAVPSSYRIASENKI